MRQASMIALHAVGVLLAIAALSSATSAYAQSPPPLRLSNPETAKRATKCAAEITGATVKFLESQLDNLRTCAKKAAACLHAPDKLESCLGKGAKPCRSAIVKLQAAETRFSDKFLKKCSGLGLAMDDLTSLAGLAYSRQEDTCAQIGIDLETPLRLAQCLIRSYARTAQRLASIQAPRSREFITLLADVSGLRDLPGYEGCYACGEQALGKLVGKCDAVVSGAASKLTVSALKTINKCYNALFKCEQQEAPAKLELCRLKAAVKCQEAQISQRAAREVANAQIRLACEAIYETYRLPQASNTDALGCECERVGIDTLDQFNDYLSCFSKQHECRAAELTRLGAPRIDELLASAKLSLTDILCAPTVPKSAQLGTTEPRAGCSTSVGICRFIRRILGRFPRRNNPFGSSIIKFKPKNAAVFVPGKASPEQARAATLQITGAKAVAPGEARRINVSYQVPAAIAGERAPDQQLVIAVQRLDGTLVDDDAFAGTLDPEDVQLNMNVEYPVDASGCGFRLVFGVDDGTGVGELQPFDLIAPKCLGARNNRIEADEECDDGDGENEDDCTNGCRLNVCGDGFRNPAKEACDDGNLVDGDACSQDCTLTVKTPTPSPGQPTATRTSTPTVTPTPTFTGPTPTRSTTPTATPTTTILEIIDPTGDHAVNPLNNPSGIAVDAAGNAYVSGTLSDNAFRITAAGAITRIIGSAGDGAGNTLDGASGIAVDTMANVYVSAIGSDNVFKITPGGVITEIIDLTGDQTGNALVTADSVAVDGNQNVFVVGRGSDNAFKITPGGVRTEIIDATGDGVGNPFDEPAGIAVDGSGNVYVPGRGSDNVFKITPAGVKTEIIDAAGDGAGNALDGSGGVAVDNQGNVYVTGVFSDNVFRITPGGAITEIIDATGDGIGHTLDFPEGIATDASRNVYVTGATNVFKITPGGVITQILDASGDGGANLLSSPGALAVGPTGSIYVTGLISDNAFKVTLAP